MNLRKEPMLKVEASSLNGRYRTSINRLVGLWILSLIIGFCARVTYGYYSGFEALLLNGLVLVSGGVFLMTPVAMAIIGNLAVGSSALPLSRQQMLRTRFMLLLIPVLLPCGLWSTWLGITELLKALS